MKTLDKLSWVIACVICLLSLFFLKEHQAKNPTVLYVETAPQAIARLKAAAESRGMNWKVDDMGRNDYCASALAPDGTDFIECGYPVLEAVEKCIKDIENNNPYSIPPKTLAHGEPKKQSTNGDCSSVVVGNTGDVQLSCN